VSIFKCHLLLNLGVLDGSKCYDITELENWKTPAEAWVDIKERV